MAANPPAGHATAERPLEGRTVVVTRTLEQSAALAGPLVELGAEVLAFPVIDIVDPDDWAPVDAAIAALGSYAWVVFSSANAVDRFVQRLVHAGLGPETLAAARVAVVGTGTARRLAEHGIEPDVMPTEFRGEGLVEAFRQAGAGPGWRILIPRALEAREVLPDALSEMGAAVDVVPVYRTVRAQPDVKALETLRMGRIDAVTFTSPSTFTHFVGVLEEAGIDATEFLGGVVAASIGPVTSDAMRARGFEPAVEAEESTIQGLVVALAKLLGRGSDQG